MAVKTQMKAYDFHESLGVNIAFSNAFYWDNQAIGTTLNSAVTAMKYIGCRRVRDLIWNTSYYNPASGIGSWPTLVANYGPNPPLKINFVVDGILAAPHNTSTWGQFAWTAWNQQALISGFAGTYGPNIESIECPSQINNTGITFHGPVDQSDQTSSYVTNAPAWALAVWNWVHSQSNLQNVKIVGPSVVPVGGFIDYSTWNVSANVDYGNMQLYPGSGQQPDALDTTYSYKTEGTGSIAGQNNGGQWTPSGAKPPSISEIGFHSPLDTTDYCSDLAQAKLMVNALCDLNARGGYRMYTYQLSDGANDPGGLLTGGNHYGLFHYDWTPKTSAQAFNRIYGMVNDMANGAGFIASSYPTVTVTPSPFNNASQSGQQLTLAKSDGSFVIVVWNEPQIYNSTGHTDLSPTAFNVSVNWGNNVAYTILDPVTGTTSSGTAIAITVPLQGYAKFIKIAAASTGGGTGGTGGTGTGGTGAITPPSVGTVTSPSPNNQSPGGHVKII